MQPAVMSGMSAQISSGIRYLMPAIAGNPKETEADREKAIDARISVNHTRVNKAMDARVVFTEHSLTSPGFNAFVDRRREVFVMTHPDMFPSREQIDRELSLKAWREFKTIMSEAKNQADTQPVALRISAQAIGSAPSPLASGELHASREEEFTSAEELAIEKALSEKVITETPEIKLVQDLFKLAEDPSKGLNIKLKESGFDVAQLEEILVKSAERGVTNLPPLREEQHKSAFQKLANYVASSPSVMTALEEIGFDAKLLAEQNPVPSRVEKLTPEDLAAIAQAIASAKTAIVALDAFISSGQRP